MTTGFESIDEWYNGDLGCLYQQRVLKVLNKFLPNKIFTGYALDAGCGAGNYTIKLSEYYNTFGADRSEILISKAVSRSVSADRDINFLTADLQCLPFRSNLFDLILCLNALEFVSDTEKAIKELKRVLIPGGTLLIGVCNKYSLWGLVKLLGKPFRRKDPFFNGNFFSIQEAMELANDAGLFVERIEKEIFFPPVNNKAIALNYEKFARNYLKRFPGIFIISLRKKL